MILRESLDWERKYRTKVAYMKPLVVASNMYNEIDQVEEWFDNMIQIADGGILIVDTGSTDGTAEFFMEKKDVTYVQDGIILREGYGPARNHLRELSRQFHGAHWMIYLDADERIEPEDFHKLRFLKDYLVDDFDVIALPRLNRLSKDNHETKVDFRIAPDYQARMTRLDSPLRYVRKLHEQVVDFKRVYTELTSPKIQHHHRSTSKEKRDFIGKVCAKLHMEDKEHGATYPDHHKEKHYRELLKKEGLGK